MNMETKRQVFERYKEQYFKAKAKSPRAALTKILDTICEVTGIHRKAAIRKLHQLQARDPSSADGRGRATYYGPDVTAALREVWLAAGEICGELLHPLIREYVIIFQRDNMWSHDEVATGKLLAASVGTIKNRVGQFQKIGRKGRGLSATTPSLIKHIIPIFHGDWQVKPPGSGQLDTVAHCGHTLSGDFIYSLNYIDVATLWDVLVAQWNKGQLATQISLAAIQAALPWSLAEVHPDSGTEFINWHLKGWCDTNNIKMTRSRPNRKNDNMHVEERNGHIVRKWIGHMRLDCPEAVKALNDIYAVLNPYLNHFIASRRVIEKFEVNGKWKKRYEKVAKTPYQRVLASEQIPEAVKEKLRIEHAGLNPAVMKNEIDRLKAILYNVQRKYGSQNLSKN